MRKIYIVALAMVFAASAMAASASAETVLLAEWLLAGAPITGLTPTETEGEILFEDDKTALGKLAVVCSMKLDGWVGPDGLGAISEVLSLTSGKIEALTTTGLLCQSETGCEAATEASPIEVWPNSNITKGWETRLSLLENGTFFNTYFGSGEQVLCLVLGAMFEDECTAGETGLRVVNGTAGAEIPAAEVAEPLASCTNGALESGVDETASAWKIKSGGEITVSSEGAGR